MRYRRAAWIEWFLVELGLNTGLRVFEITNLTCGDVVLREELSHVLVRKGKCGKARQVWISKDFQKSITQFFKWKRKQGESVNPNAPLIYSSRGKGKYSTRGLQSSFKRCLKHASITTYHSIHHLRHTYASCLLVSSKNNLRLVQKQMGHSSIATTQVYLHVFSQEIETAIEKLF